LDAGGRSGELSCAVSGARQSTAAAAAAREWGRRGSGEGDRVEASGGVGRHPDQVMPVGRAAAATSPAYGRHEAGTGWSEAGASAHGRGGARPRG